MNDPKTLRFLISDEGTPEIATMTIEYLPGNRALASFTFEGRPCGPDTCKAIMMLFAGVARMLTTAEAIVVDGTLS